MNAMPLGIPADVYQSSAAAWAVGGAVEVAGGAGVEPLVVAGRRHHGAVVVRPAIAAIVDERPPLGGELGLAAALGERREEAGLGGDGLVDAELVEQPQAALDVPVGAARVAAQVVEHAEDVLDAARREPVAAAPGERRGRVDRGSGPIELAEDDGEDRVGDPDDG